MFRSRLFRIVIGALAAAIVLGIAGEAAVRYRERTRESIPGSMPSIFYQHGRLGHALVRDSDYYDWVHVNRHGFRGPDIPLEKPAGTLRVMAVGASTTFDAWTGPDGNAWPARLEHWLNRNAGAADRRIEVINAGVPGYVVQDNIIRLQSELHRFRPDLILLYHTHNDLFRAIQKAVDPGGDEVRRPGELPTVTPWGRWLARHSILYNKLMARWKAIRFGLRFERDRERRQLSASDWEAAIEAGARNFERDVRSFVLIARGMGIPVVLVGVVQTWNEDRAYAPLEHLVRGYERYDRALREVAEECGATYMSSADFGLTGTEWFAPRDAIHFSAQGADRFARRLAESLNGTGVLVDPAVATVRGGAGTAPADPCRSDRGPTRAARQGM